MVLARPVLFMLLFAGITALLGWQYTRMNTSFLPQEDQGALQVQFSTPPGTVLAETTKVGGHIVEYFMTEEKDNLGAILLVVGRNFSGTSHDAGMAFVMTSLAFVAGVLPLAVSTGAGAASRRTIGIAVTGGMVSGTVLAIFFVPLFFLLVQRIFGGGPRNTKADTQQSLSTEGH